MIDWILGQEAKMADRTTTCGYAGCTRHKGEYDVNHEVRQTAAYRQRPWLCKLSLHPHSKAGGYGMLECVRCGFKWRWI